MRLPRRLSEPGPILTYLLRLRAMNEPLATEAVEKVRAVLLTEEGAMLLELLEKSTLELNVPVSAGDSALAALNAQSFIATDLRRIVSDEIEQVLDRKTDLQPRGRRGTGAR